MWSELGKLTVLDSGGEAVQLERIWQQRPTLFVFVRHFG